MTIRSGLTGRFAAAISALTLSLVLISGTVATPGTAQAHTAYVGVIA
ncbi:MAG: hypothetical protein RLZZ84_462 [Pseudomonadota bacterium]|jgi:hypothetical protein